MLICRQAELSQDHVVRIVAIMVVTAVLVNEELLLKRYPKGSAPEAEAEGARFEEVRRQAQALASSAN